MSELTRTEADELYVMVGQAFELKGLPYFIDACQAIVDWQEGRYQRRLERRHQGIAELRRLLRETAPPARELRRAA